MINRKELHFGVDLTFLLTFCLQKAYEQQVSRVDKQPRENQWYPAWERFTEMKKEEYDFIADCEEFMLRIQAVKENNEVTLTLENLGAFALWWWEHKMFTDEMYLNKIACLEETRQRKLRYLEFIKWEGSGIWNKETDAFIEARFGEHWNVILRECLKKFGHSFIEDEKNWEEIDAWINKSIAMKGTWFPDQHYTLQSQGHTNTDGILRWLSEIQEQETEDYDLS